MIATLFLISGSPKAVSALLRLFEALSTADFNSI